MKLFSYKEAEILQEAKLLREHKDRLESRMKLLAVHNSQLESQLGKLKQILQEVLSILIYCIVQLLTSFRKKVISLSFCSWPLKNLLAQQSNKRTKRSTTCSLTFLLIHKSIFNLKV